MTLFSQPIDFVYIGTVRRRWVLINLVEVKGLIATNLQAVLVWALEVWVWAAWALHCTIPS